MMASLSALHKNPRPWHTRSFYIARFALIGVAVLMFSNILPTPIFSGLSVALAFDAVAIWRWTKEQMQLPSPLTDGSIQGKREAEMLRIAVAYCVIGFAVAALTIVFTSGMREPLDLLYRFIAMALLNMSGWYYMQWFREVATLFKQYNPPKVSVAATVAASVSPQPIVTVYKPIKPQAAPQIVRVGESA